jgi:DNA-binding protein
MENGERHMAERKQRKANSKKEKAPEPPKAAQTTEASDKVVFVGQKPVKNYVIACLTSFSSGSNKVVIKARGRAICRAVDTFELLRRAFLKDAQLQGISICTEQVAREGDRKANVSAIEITVAKP